MSEIKLPKKTFYRPTAANWLIVNLLGLVMLCGLGVCISNYLQAHSKLHFDPEGLVTGLFLGTVFILVPLYLFRLFITNWLSEVFLDDEGFRLSGLLFNKQLRWEAIQGVSVRRVEGRFTNLKMVLRYRDEGHDKKLEFMSAFGPIGHIVLERLVEARPDLDEGWVKRGGCSL